MNTLYTIVGLFALGAIIGMYLLAMVLQNKATPKGVVFVHGLFVVIALIMLIVYVTNHTPGPIESLVLFVIAAVGGLIVFYTDITGKKIPKWLAVLHGLTAVSGFVFLLLFTFAK
jgi:hypothetical protein